MRSYEFVEFWYLAAITQSSLVPNIRFLLPLKSLHVDLMEDRLFLEALAGAFVSPPYLCVVFCCCLVTS